MSRKIINAISSKYVPQWGNGKKYIAIHYLGVVGQNHELQSDGCGAHFYIYWDGTIYQRCDLDAVVWAVGTAGYYTQKHPNARNANTISIEMCCKCDGNSASAEDPYWYFTTETQEACVWLVQKLMKEQGIPAENVLRHYDIVNKTCPAPYVHNNKYKTSWTWNEFKEKIGAPLSDSDNSATSSSEVEYYRVRKSWKDEKSQLGAYEVKENAIKNCPIGYKVFDSKGNVVYENNGSNDSSTDSNKSGTQTSEFATLTEQQAAEKLLSICKDIVISYKLFPSVATAQTILESGYCKTELARKANNVCGMKEMLSGNTWEGSTWDGSSVVNIKTAEQDKNGNTYYIYANFRAYKCIEDSIKDRCAYILGAINGSKKRYEGIQSCKTYKEQIQLIKDGGYATDVSYVSKICNIIERFGLDKYDNLVISATDKTDKDKEPSKQETPKDNTSTSKNEAWYRVRKEWGTTMDGQLGAYKELDTAKKECPAWYKVFDKNGKAVFDPTTLSVKEIINRAVDWAIKTADENLIGYDASDEGRDGTLGLACTTFVTKSYLYGGVKLPDTGAIWTTNMVEPYKQKGFKDISSKINFKTGSGLKKGDVIINVGHHTALFVGDGKIAHAMGNELGTSTGGQPGDQSGYEIAVQAYYNHPWKVALRYTENVDAPKKGSTSDKTTDSAKPKTYIVQLGSFSIEANAKNLVNSLKKKGFDALYKKVDNNYIVQAGSFAIKDNAVALSNKLLDAGFQSIIKEV